MFSKVVFVLATFFVVNASVIMINVFDDKPEVANEPRDCNFRACDQLCRRLGFPSGTCINGRCKCDNFLNADNNKTEVAHEQRDCNFRACDQLCRRLGFPSGTCINGRCKCDNFLNAVPSSIIEALSSRDEESNLISRSNEVTDDLSSSATRSCSLVDCNLSCQRQGKTGGFCAGNRCFCY